MARFRFHRGGLQESLMTEIFVDSLNDIERVISSNHQILTPLANLKCEFYGKDYREGAYKDTYIVTAYDTHGRSRLVLGFADSMIEKDHGIAILGSKTPEPVRTTRRAKVVNEIPTAKLECFVCESTLERLNELAESRETTTGRIIDELIKQHDK